LDVYIQFSWRPGGVNPKSRSGPEDCATLPETSLPEPCLSLLRQVAVGNSLNHVPDYPPGIAARSPVNTFLSEFRIFFGNVPDGVPTSRKRIFNEFVGFSHRSLE
jgi:hypothetical protein